jgi:DNA-binding CsgD family transcriptional regulator
MGKLFLGDITGALVTARQAEHAAVAAGDIAAEVRAVLTRAHVAAMRGDFLEGAHLAARAVDLAVRSPSVETFASMPHHVQAMALVEVDDIAGAVTAAEAAQSAASRLGVADSQVMAQVIWAQAHFHGERWDDALAGFESAVALAEETGTAWQVECRCLAALLHAAQGRRAVAEGLAARAAADVAAGRPAYRVHWLAWVKAVLADDAGHPEQAVDLLLPAWQRSVAHGVRSELRRFGPLLARATAATGRTDDAEAIATALEEHAAQNPGVVGLAATARRARGLAAGDADVLLEALALHADVPRAHERARCAEETALALLASGRGQEAREVAEQAVAAYSLLRAEGELARCRSALRAGGLRLGVRGPRRRPASGWAALTDTEAEVARLVAARLSNPEIAEQMFLSRRTVGHHVSHVLAKLHMTSRVELAAAAARGPLEDL